MSRPRRAVLEFRSYELPSGFPLIVLTGDEWHISATPSSHLHFHNCLEIGLCHSGGGTMLFDRQPTDFGPGCVTCVARNVPHTTWSSAGNPSLWSYVFLDPELLLGHDLFQQLAPPTHTRDFLSDCHIVLTPERDARAAALVAAIVDECVKKAPGYQLCVRGHCLALMIHLLRAYYSGEPVDSATGASAHALSPALDYLHRNYTQAFDQDHLADLCHLSKSHFRRLFKAQIGVSPLVFLHQTRILNSCTLLRASERLISEVVATVGYDSLSCFNRHFHEIMGCTPSEWRRTAGGEGRPSLLAFTGWTRAEALDEKE